MSERITVLKVCYARKQQRPDRFCLGVGDRAAF
jgi:hypothetical protein